MPQSQPFKFGTIDCAILVRPDQQVNRLKFEIREQTQRTIQPPLTFLEKCFRKREREINSLKLLLKQALNTVNCNKKAWIAKSATRLGRGFNYYVSPIVHFEHFQLW